MSLGSDFSAVDDLDANLTFLSGDVPEELAFAQALVRRISTPRGGLFYRQDYGLDVRELIGDTANPAIVAKQIAGEIKKDQRVTSSTCSILAIGETWQISISATAQSGVTYTLTVNVSQVTVDLLKVTTS